MDTRKHQLLEFQRAAFQRRFDLKKRALQLQQEKQNAATTASLLLISRLCLLRCI